MSYVGQHLISTFVLIMCFSSLIHRYFLLPNYNLEDPINRAVSAV